MDFGSKSSPGGASDENDGENEPEHVAEDDDLHHVQVRPAHTQHTGQTSTQSPRDGRQVGTGRSQPAGHEVRNRVEMKLSDSIGDLSVISVQLTVVPRQEPDGGLKLLLKYLQLQRRSEEEQEVVWKVRGQGYIHQTSLAHGPMTVLRP